MIRLDKFLADQKLGTRSELKSIIKKGQVLVNGEIVKNPELKINPSTDQVIFQGKSLQYEEFSYYVFHKPAGIITANQDKNAITVMDYFKDCPQRDLFPVGRLDKDTYGLLLITNHGALAHKLLAPKSHVDKVYYVGLRDALSENDRKQIEEGVSLGQDGISAPAKCEIVVDDRFRGCVQLTIHEGKFHQVKRMFEAVSNEVVYLRRIAFGPLVLEDTLLEGDFRRCREDEVRALLSLLNDTNDNTLE